MIELYWMNTIYEDKRLWCGTSLNAVAHTYIASWMIWTDNVTRKEKKKKNEKVKANAVEKKGEQLIIQYLFRRVSENVLNWFSIEWNERAIGAILYIWSIQFGMNWRFYQTFANSARLIFLQFSKISLLDLNCRW